MTANIPSGYTSAHFVSAPSGRRTPPRPSTAESVDEGSQDIQVGPSPTQFLDDPGVVTRDSVLFSPRMAASMDPANGTWHIVDRGDGHLVNLAPFYGDDINYLALTCYYLKQQDERGEPRDIVGAAKFAGRDSSQDDDEMMDFMLYFTVAAVDLVDP